MCRFNDSVFLNAWDTEVLSLINIRLWTPVAFSYCIFLVIASFVCCFVFACERTGSIQVVTVTAFAVFDPVFEFTLDCASSLYWKMSATKEVTSARPSGDARAEKSVEKLNVKEFRDRFCVPNGVSVELFDGRACCLRSRKITRYSLPRSSLMLGFDSLSLLCSRNFCTSPRFLQCTYIPT
ncbi:uncharacterized protein LOC117920082 [Vitis riparia]|uniref:uncharacterized protein LOC117920082 n=1 Tax=Vitis riparia TaxID=96939 RepID=UPI00155A9138|nr:uncharacterized protein LOC117920082 [Vitis riparia]